MKKFFFRHCATVSKSPVMFFAMFVFYLAMFFYIKNLSPDLYGDGKEYLLQTVAFQNHLSFGVTTADLERAKLDFPNYAESLDSELHGNHMHKYKDSYYSNHYGMYSALVAPVMVLTRLLNINPLRAFSFTNLLLWLTAILVVFFYLKTTKIKKYCIISLLLFNPIFFYLNWSHTEIFIFSFVVIGLVCLYNKWYGRSIFFLSIAAMQNLTVIAYGMIVGVDYIISLALNYKIKNTKFSLLGFIEQYWKKILPYAVFYIPAFIPLVSTYLRFGTYNLVAKQAMENKYLLSKSFNYIFDLNLGIFPYEPIMLFTFFIFTAIGIKKNPRATFLNLTGVGLMFYIVAHQVQINCGMQNIMRYNVWIIPVMLFFTAMSFDQFINKRFFVGFSITQSLYTTILVLYIIFGGGQFDYNTFSPWTEFIIERIPQIYNPTHGIFYSRTLNRETYRVNGPIAYVDKNGFVKKILFKQGMDISDVFIVDETGRIDLNTVKKKFVDSGDYYYLNFSSNNVKLLNNYNLGKEIIFKKKGFNAKNYFQRGLSGAEESGCWTEGKYVLSNLLVDASKTHLSCQIDIGGVFYWPQDVLIKVNGVQLINERVSEEKTLTFSFENGKDGDVCMEIYLPNAVSPNYVFRSPDARVLGLWLNTMKIIEDKSK